jgi:hypothetical protein
MFDEAGRRIPLRNRASRHWLCNRLLAFDKFSEQFAHFRLGSLERLPAKRRRSINFPERFASPLFLHAKVALFLQPMQERVEAAGTDSVSVPSQFLGHAETKDRPFNSVVEDVEAYQTRV